MPSRSRSRAGSPARSQRDGRPQGTKQNVTFANPIASSSAGHPAEGEDTSQESYEQAPMMMKRGSTDFMGLEDSIQEDLQGSARNRGRLQSANCLANSEEILQRLKSETKAAQCQRRFQHRAGHGADWEDVETVERDRKRRCSRQDARRSSSPDSSQEMIVYQTERDRSLSPEDRVFRMKPLSWRTELDYDSFEAPHRHGKYLVKKGLDGSEYVMVRENRVRSRRGHRDLPILPLRCHQRSRSPLYLPQLETSRRLVDLPFSSSSDDEYEHPQSQKILQPVTPSGRSSRGFKKIPLPVAYKEEIEEEFHAKRSRNEPRSSTESDSQLNQRNWPVNRRQLVPVVNYDDEEYGRSKSLPRKRSRSSMKRYGSQKEIMFDDDHCIESRAEDCTSGPARRNRILKRAPETVVAPAAELVELEAAPGLRDWNQMAKNVTEDMDKNGFFDQLDAQYKSLNFKQIARERGSKYHETIHGSYESTNADNTRALLQEYLVASLRWVFDPAMIMKFKTTSEEQGSCAKQPEAKEIPKLHPCPNLQLSILKPEKTLRPSIEPSKNNSGNVQAVKQYTPQAEHGDRQRASGSLTSGNRTPGRTSNPPTTPGRKSLTSASNATPRRAKEIPIQDLPRRKQEVPAPTTPGHGASASNSGQKRDGNSSSVLQASQGVVCPMPPVLVAEVPVHAKSMFSKPKQRISRIPSQTFPTIPKLDPQEPTGNSQQLVPISQELRKEEISLLSSSTKSTIPAVPGHKSDGRSGSPPAITHVPATPKPHLQYISQSPHPSITDVTNTPKNTLSNEQIANKLEHIQHQERRRSSMITEKLLMIHNISPRRSARIKTKTVATPIRIPAPSEEEPVSIKNMTPRRVTFPDPVPVPGHDISDHESENFESEESELSEEDWDPECNPQGFLTCPKKRRQKIPTGRRSHQTGSRSHQQQSQSQAPSKAVELVQQKIEKEFEPHQQPDCK